MNTMKWNTTPWIKAATLAALLPMAAATAWAADVDEVRDVQPDATVEFAGVTGEFRIVGADVDQLRVSGKLGDEVEELVIEGDPSHWRIRLEMKDGGRNGWSWNQGPSTVLEVTVPHGSDMSAATVSADLEVDGLRGPRLEAKTVSGDLMISGSSPARLMAESVSGDIEVDGGGIESSSVKAVSGDIEAFGLAGRVRAASVSGDLELDAIEVSEFNAETVSGDLDAVIQPLASARVDVQTHSGRLDLTVPAGTAIDVDAETFSGDLENHFVSDIENFREKGMTVRNGDGGVRIRAQTFSGEFILRQSDR